jgi:hypothetical protein
LPLAQPFTDHTEQALCSEKKGQSRELGITYQKTTLRPLDAHVRRQGRSDHFPVVATFVRAQ